MEVCECGHSLSDHSEDGEGSCWGEDGQQLLDCTCRAFVLGPGTESSRDKLLEHLEDSKGVGHGFQFAPWRETLPLGALTSIHESHHRDEERNPEGFHTHPGPVSL